MEKKIIYTPEAQTITIDWFEAFGSIGMEPLQEREILELGSVIFEGTAFANPTFRSIALVYICQPEPVLFGELSYNIRLGQVGDKNAAKLKILNEHLYTGTWMEDFQFFIRETGFKFNNITRLDIAVDGCSAVIPFLNKYIMNKKYDMAGRAEMTLPKWNKTDRRFERFQIGSHQSEKHISVYLKSNEIKKSDKYYIQEYWKRSGMDIKKDITRVELRLKSKALQTMQYINPQNQIYEDFDYTLLEYPQYLAGIVQLHITNYFEFMEVNKKDKNKSRWQRLELFDLKKFDPVPLERNDVKDRCDRYKAKLSIHLMEKERLKEVDPHLNEARAKIIKTYLFKHKLDDWYMKSLKEWEKKYKPGIQKNNVPDFIIDDDKSAIDCVYGNSFSNVMLDAFDKYSRK